MNVKLFQSCVVLLVIFSMTSISCDVIDGAENKKQQPGVSAISDSGNLLTEQQFNALFPRRLPFYTYQAFVKAAKEMANIRVRVTQQSDYVFQIIRFEKDKNRSTIIRQDADWNKPWVLAKPAIVNETDLGKFCNEKDLATNKRELAAFFANIGHETRKGENGKFDDGLMLISEADTSLKYIYPNNDYPAVEGKKYYGRGPLQLSYNGNYGFASIFIFGNKDQLLNDPGLITRDAVVAFKTAIFFWMTPQANKPSAHDVMTGKWQPAADDLAKNRQPGFGMTINIINGALECNKGDAMGTMSDRIGFYKHFLKALNASDPNCACSCGNMQPYAF